MKQKVSVWLNRFAPPLLWMGVIFLFSSFQTLPGASVIWWDFILKKSAHMVEYAVLFYLWHRALAPLPKKQRVGWTFAICLSYAISDELHQSMTPGRYPQAMDVGFDTLGMSVMALKLYKYI